MKKYFIKYKNELKFYKIIENKNKYYSHTALKISKKIGQLCRHVAFTVKIRNSKISEKFQDSYYCEKLKKYN